VFVAIDRYSTDAFRCGQQAARLIEAKGVDADSGLRRELFDPIFHAIILRVIARIVEAIGSWL